MTSTEGNKYQIWKTCKDLNFESTDVIIKYITYIELNSQNDLKL